MDFTVHGFFIWVARGVDELHVAQRWSGNCTLRNLKFAALRIGTV
jgi:hypothetical protein